METKRADSMLVFDLRAFARDYEGSALAGRLTTAANELDRLYEVERRSDAAPDLCATLSDAAQTFRRYAEMHRAKNTVEGEQKAAANDYCARQCEAAIARARGETTTSQS